MRRSRLGQAEFARQGLDRLCQQPLVQGRQPGPHDAAAIGCEHAFGREEIPHRQMDMRSLTLLRPVHAPVCFRDELFVLRVPVAKVVAAAVGMADAEQHPLARRSGKEIRAGDILADGDVIRFVGEKVADVSPVLQIRGFQERRILARRRSRSRCRR